MSKSKQTVTTKEVTKSETQQSTKANNDVIMQQLVDKLIAKDNKVVSYEVSGYKTLKYNNSVLCELHFKKRSLSHVTFSQKQQTVLKVLKDNKLIHRIVPASYHWKFDIECLVTNDFIKQFETLLKLAYENALPKIEPKAKEIAKA